MDRKESIPLYYPFGPLHICLNYCAPIMKISYSLVEKNTEGICNLSHNGLSVLCGFVTNNNLIEAHLLFLSPTIKRTGNWKEAKFENIWKSPVFLEKF